METDLQRQIDRLATQVDRMQLALDSTYVRREIYDRDIEALRKTLHEERESSQWMRRTFVVVIAGFLVNIALFVVQGFLT